MEINYKSIFYPPGGILIWIIIYLELITFGAAMVTLGYYGVTERAQFHSDSQSLNKTIAAVNTVFLLTSGYLVAKAVHYFKSKAIEKSAQQFLWAMLFGLGF